MKKVNFTRLVLLVAVLWFTLSGVKAQDLSPWTDNPYGNEWIDYSKKYVRVGVPVNGLYRVSFSSLASSLKKGAEVITPEQIQIWHRGKEVAVISSDNDWVVFYGEKNDGASDGLMFRPGPEARLNPYVSFFSEEGSYFFTVSTNPSRALAVNSDPTGSGLVAEPYHFEQFLRKFDNYEVSGKREKQVFSFSTFIEGSALNHSYYVNANSWTSPIIYGPSVVGNTLLRSYVTNIKLNKIKHNAPDKPVFDIVVNGHDEGAHNIKVYASSANGDVGSKLISTLAFNSYGGVNARSDLQYGSNVSELGDVNLLIKSETNDSRDAFGISYFSVVFPQSIDMMGNTLKVFNFKPTSNSQSLISISDLPINSKIYDISIAHQPRLLNNAQYDSGAATLNVKVERLSNRELRLLAVSPSHTIGTLTTLNKVDLEPLYGNNTAGVDPRSFEGSINPKAYDYLIITNNDSDPARAGDRDLRSGSIAYAKDYRSTVKGGSYSTLVMDIRSIYDQFNYGEPSALAIKRFVDYMIQNGVRDKHNLLLIGYSVTIPVNIVKEMPGEVPSFGDPGSDVLLVTGLKNSPNIDIPAIPVGRINAFNNSELAIYRSKVTEYERQSLEDSETALSWRKNIVHLVGAKRYYELADFKGVFSGVSNHVLQLDPTRNIKLLSNDAYATSQTVDAVSATAPMDIEVNKGVGMIAYYGHGNQAGTIYNIGKVSTPNFEVNNKYCFIYFNGCGVGNIFTSRGSQMLATDWLITPGKGAVMVFGNSYKSYVSPTKIYIDELYKQVFLKNDQQRRTSGQILKDLASITISGSVGNRVLADAFAVTNIHQTNLYGDPALKILNSVPQTTLPVSLVSFNAAAVDSSKIAVNWSTQWEQDNSHFIIERSYNSKNFEEIGSVEGKGNSITSSFYNFIDPFPYSGVNYYRLKQVDKSGSFSSQKFTYSKVISVKVPNTSQFFVYPNPVTDVVNIRLNIPTRIKEWRIMDVNGNVLSVGNGVKIGVKSLRSGKYIVEIETDNRDIFRSQIIKN